MNGGAGALNAGFGLFTLPILVLFWAIKWGLVGVVLVLLCIGAVIRAVVITIRDNNKKKAARPHIVHPATYQKQAGPRDWVQE